MIYVYNSVCMIYVYNSVCMIYVYTYVCMHVRITCMHVCMYTRSRICAINGCRIRYICAFVSCIPPYMCVRFGGQKRLLRSKRAGLFPPKKKHKKTKQKPLACYTKCLLRPRGCQPPPPLSPRPDCMCESVYKYICIRTRIHIIYRCIFTHRHAYIQYIYICTHISIHDIQMYTHAQTRMHTIHIHMHTHKYTCKYSHTNTHTYTYMTRLSAFTSALSEN